MSKLQFDILCENFDHFFAKEASIMSPNQKESLPPELVYKIFKRGHTYDNKATTKLSFIAKLFILFKASRKRWIIIVEDEVNGMSEEQYFEYKRLHGRNEVNVDLAEPLVSQGIFVLGCKELVDSYAKLNMVSISGVYNYLVKSKNKDYTKPDEWIAQMNYVARFLSNYESNRKTIAMQTRLNMSEFMVLLNIYHGKSVLSASIWKDVYRYSFNSSKTLIKVAFGTLQSKGYIEKIGVNKGANIQITALGKDVINDIMSKYVVNC